MFSYLLNKIQKAFQKESKDKNNNENQTEQKPFSANLSVNINRLKEIFDHCNDVVFREFNLGLKQPVKALLIYIDGLSDKTIINEVILKPLMTVNNDPPMELKINQKTILEMVKRQIVNIGGIQETPDLIQAVNLILSGNALLLIDGYDHGLVLKVGAWSERPVSEPETETVVRGPRDGFTENLRVNIALIRRRVITTRLKIERLQVGLLSRANIDVLYIKGIANEKIVEEVKNRIKRIKTDKIISSGELEEFITDLPSTIFPQSLATERPDKIAAGLFSGQIAIVVDNSPFVLLVPITFFHLLQAAEDYNNNYLFSTVVRLLRFIALNIALLLPPFYIAVVTFHQEMLPTPLLISIAAAREGVPFPAFVEAMLMEITFEILREAGVRLPRPVGQAVSIVGALVIGEAAVTAGIVSPAMVIVVSLTAISNFTIPNTSGSNSIRLLRFPIMFMAASFGLFGIMIALMAILTHLTSLRSFGLPYLSPIAPTTFQDLKDVLIRVPWFKMNTRPKLIGKEEPYRQDSDLRPEPPPPRKPGSDKQGGN